MAKIICNPLNLEYRYQNRVEGGRPSLSREGADPTMLLWRDKYLLFVSMSGGFWYSDDLANWQFHETPELPIYDYAPDVRVVDGKVVFSASRHTKCSFYTSGDPLNEPFQPMPENFAWWDPNIFQDDDGRVYFYWGCSTKPIHGVEVDRRTLTPIGKKVQIIAGNPKSHGWERRGENNVAKKPETHMEKMMALALGTGPFIEGAYMTKHDGRYYFQYAAPGTEFNVYGNGVYVGDQPLGPFTYQRHNPFSAVPGGFMTAAGHGSTFQDKNGRWWHVSTMLIGVNEKFERRVGLFPCDFDESGVMHCDQALADYPFDVESGEKTGWMLLDGKASASSAQTGCGPENAVNENVRTWWAAERAGEDQYLLLDLGEAKTVHAVQVNFADHQLSHEEADMVKNQTGSRKIYVQPRRTRYLLEGSEDGETWAALRDLREAETDYCHDFFCLETPAKLRFLRLSHMELPFGGVPAVSGFRVFGKGNGAVPAAVKAVRHKYDGPLNILLDWDAAEGATRYNVRYGISPDKLYGSWQVTENHLNFSFVNAGEPYFSAVDSINENGVTPGEAVKIG